MAFLRREISFIFSLWGSLLYGALMTLPLGADAPKRSQYHWRTGVWGVCVANDCGSVGLQSRPVWCVHSEGWSTHQSNCFPSERPPHQRMCVKTCEWQKDLFEWHLSPWGPCTPTPFLPANQCVTAQRGLQSRDVVCVKRPNNTTVSPHVCEAFSSSPEREQACLLPCPIDCIVSAFSHWSTCSRTCGSALQQRTRHVLATPLYRGADCPSLTQTRPCNHDNAHPALCPSDQQEYGYGLWVGPWSPCRLKGTAPIGKTTVDFNFGNDGKKGVKASYTIKRHTENIDHHNHYHYDDKKEHKASWEITIGYQTRQLRCTRSDGKNAMLSLCDHDNSPVNFRSCVMPRDCKVSDWSQWSPCSKTCRTSDQSPGFRRRSRSLKRTAIGGGEPCPTLEEMQSCNILEDTLPLCPRYEWRVTNWNPCQVTPLLSQDDHRHSNASVLCGGGIQTREAYCVRIHNNTAASHMNRPVERSLCSGPLPPLAQSCSILCGKHCPFTPWSPWGPCLHDNCLEPQGKRGFRMRTRSVIMESWVESDSCFHVMEAMVCDDPVCFLWQVTSQGPCLPLNGSCGPGTQEQTLECFSVTGELVPSERCPENPPPAQQPCQVACSGDCVLGQWSSWSFCSQSCSSKHSEGKQIRSRSVLALPGKEGKLCPPAPELEQWRPCGSHSCVVYHWDTSLWGPCTPDSSTDELNTTDLVDNEGICGMGVQMRQVTCRRAGNGHVVPKRCPESSRPTSIQSCPLPCKIDCVVTPFSEWSPCPRSCSLANSTAPIQSRHRTVIQRAANGGQECPDTLYEERECDPPPLCPTYRWQTHRWHQCILVPDWVRQAVGGPTETCGIGLETREVTCVGVDDSSADMAECVRWAGVMPTQVRECRVPCRDECTFTSWSRFTPCQGCGSWRTRTRSLIGRSKKRWRCQQEEPFPLMEKEACPCSEFHTQPQGPWSPCLLPPVKNRAGHPFIQEVYHQGQRAAQGWQAQRKNSECGRGKRYRAHACLDHQGRLVEPALCSSPGYEEEVCHVPCSTDCRLSEWSNWSSCSASCGGGVKVRSQWLREKPFNGGRPCPKLNYKNQAQVSEVLPCYTDCSQYVWEVDSWSVCFINPPNLLTNTTSGMPVCGEGLRTRKIRCVKRGGQNQNEKVDDSLCDKEEQPVTAETCSMPCPAHCVTSEWSQWTKCTVDCNDSDLRWRSRTVLRWPEEEHTCPDLNQTQPCNNVTCLKYSYVYSDWSSCQLSENAVCGSGVKTRLLNCVRSDGRLVKLSMCKELGPSRGKLSAPCEVGCPVNCLLTDWSTWSECSHTCGSKSQMMRSRVVLQPAGEGGRPCPSQLSQTRPCPIRPCYGWRLGDWSQCRVEGGDCGEGVSRREISCVVHWGSLSGPPQPLPVEDKWCVGNSQGKISEMEFLQPCTIPCPGECHLTKWSPWSSCQLLCLDGRSFETWGRQARSRAVVTQVPENQDTCPSQMYETRPCQGGTCLSYEWMAGEWNHNHRLVWCQRSDGVNVTGGCVAQNRPPTIRQCHPPCTKPFSFCTQSGVCGCEKGFTEVMTSYGFLDYCTRTPGLDHKKADVKTSAGRLRPEHAQNKNQFQDWALRPLGPDGRVKLWVYGLMAAGFVVILLLIIMSFLLCKNPEDSPGNSPQKALTLAYNGDMDM